MLNPKRPLHGVGPDLPLTGGPATLDDINLRNGIDPNYLNELRNDPSNVYGTTNLRLKFTSSDAYKNAKHLFESGPQSEIWLAKLEQIVASLSVPDGNAFTDIGNFFGNTYANRFTEMLNNAFVSLNNLTNDWSKWFNELPSEQRSQFDAAGLNIALDGGSQLSGSSITPSGITPSQNFTEQQNQSFDNIVNFATSVTGGLLDLVGAVNNVFSLGLKKKEVDISQYTSLYNINKERISLGLSPFRSLQDARAVSMQDKDELSNFGVASSNEQEKKAKTSRTDLELNVNPIYNAVDDATRLGIGPYNEIMSKLGNIQLGQSIYSQLFEQEKLSFERKKLQIQSEVQDTYGAQLALGEAQTTLTEQSYKQTDFTVSGKLKELGETLIDYKKSVLEEWIKKANSDSPDAFIYSSLLMKSGLQLSDFMGPAEVGLNYIEQGSGIIDDVLGVLNPLGWFKALKKGKVIKKK